MKPAVTLACFATVTDVLSQDDRLPCRCALSTADAERYDTFTHDRDRCSFLAARLVAHALVRQHPERPPGSPTFSQRCPTCGGAHGPPRIDDSTLGVSWSHSRTWVAAAVGPSPLGIDVEDGTASVPEGVFPDVSPRDSMLHWVTRESWVKTGYMSLDDALQWPVSTSWEQWRPLPSDDLPSPEALDVTTWMQSNGVAAGGIVHQTPLIVTQYRPVPIDHRCV